MSSLRAIACALVSGVFLAFASSARAGSETPPAGPPWVRDLVSAQKEAVKQGVPIFVYFTKTY